jgi:hypothetical protein
MFDPSAKVFYFQRSPAQRARLAWGQSEKALNDSNVRFVSQSTHSSMFELSRRQTSGTFLCNVRLPLNSGH